MRGVSYTAVFLCLLIASNEFGPARFMRIESPVPRLSKKSNKSYFKGEDKHTNHNEYRRSVIEKRSLRTTIFKVVKFGSDFVNKVTTLASMISTVYLLIEQCCGGKWKDVCVWNKEVDNIQQELDAKQKKIDEMQLESMYPLMYL
ncbi:uncharacterized protein LOC116302914 [Actinia tenebrosa]|uniref:Uncharacterized protein LOC116302914 n=1 Tax=Actinia tenebrosa TaxID=6105 RepID=A0A6P8IME7_ACTTE|nr:uncharacterized protein LOC116302914 [Actinia tenebrosa]XP_031568186.1 uncharacterized protein LOC116302914 [Actinia tenebrosa]